MTDSQIFRLIGIFYLSVSIGMFLSHNYYRKLIESFFNERAALFFIGMMAVVVGYLLILHHNIWEFSISVVITIFGWLVFLKGILILSMPEFFLKISHEMLKTGSSGYLFGIATFVVSFIFFILSKL